MGVLAPGSAHARPSDQKMTSIFFTNILFNGYLNLGEKLMDVHNFLSVDLFGESNDYCLIQDAEFVVCLTVLGDKQVSSCLV